MLIIGAQSRLPDLKRGPTILGDTLVGLLGVRAALAVS
jgi:hypothetical protein